MNRSKKIEDLIHMVSRLKGYGTVPSLLRAHQDVLCEELDAHLSDYFWSCEEDSMEYITVSNDGMEYMILEDMVEYYLDHHYGKLNNELYGE